MAGQLTFQVTRPSDLRQGAEVHRGEQHGEDEEHRHAEDQLRDDEGQDHHEVERGRHGAARHRLMPSANATPSGTAMSVV